MDIHSNTVIQSFRITNFTPHRVILGMHFGRNTSPVRFPTAAEITPMHPDI